MQQMITYLLGNFKLLDLVAQSHANLKVDFAHCREFMEFRQMFHNFVVLTPKLGGVLLNKKSL